MLWVRSEYADRLAVACAWIAAVLPWNVTYSPDVAGGSLLFVRFPLFQVRSVSGIGVGPPVSIVDPLSAAAFQAGRPLELAYQVWAVGAAVATLALLLSLAILVSDEPSETQRVDPVRLMGALLGVAAIVLTAASYLLLVRGFPGPSIPIGVVFLYAFSAILLLVDRVDGDDGDGDEAATGGA